MKLPFSKAPNYSRTSIVISILLISLALRSVLIVRGGQYYIADEYRYEVSQDVVGLLMQGQLGMAISQLIISPEHLGFKVIGIIPAVIERIIGPSLAMPAMFFSLFSVLNLYLIFILSQRMSTSSNESLLALLLAASCLSFIYYSRHLFPYDTALSFGLLALYVGLAENQTNKTSLACGCLGFLCFITYNGYWSLTAFAFLVHVLTSNEAKIRLFQKAILTAVGFIVPLILVFIVAIGAGTNILSEYRLFATTITQGSYDEGWSLPFEYFWHTEHMVILILAGLSFFGIIDGFKYKRKYTGVWAAGILFIYLCLLVPSVFLHYFVVYGRLARQMLPFLILLSANGLAQLEHHTISGYKTTRLIMVTIFIQAAWNLNTSYNLSYPREFVAEAQAMFPAFEFSSKRLAFGAPLICQNNGYIIENAKYFVNPAETIPEVDGYLILSAPHPVNFLPYQYDGDPPATRQIFHIQKLRMNFYKVNEEFMSETNPAWMDIKNCMIQEK
jgi:hypothetical protein